MLSVSKLDKDSLTLVSRDSVPVESRAKFRYLRIQHRHINFSNVDKDRNKLAVVSGDVQFDHDGLWSSIRSGLHPIWGR